MKDSQITKMIAEINSMPIYEMKPLDPNNKEIIIPALRTIFLAEKLIPLILGKSGFSSIDPAILEIKYIEAVLCVGRIYFEKAFNWNSEISTWIGATLDWIFEKYDQSENSAENLNQSIHYFSKLIDSKLPIETIEIKKYTAMILRCTCYRANLNHKEAITDSRSIVELGSKYFGEQYLMLSQCLFDVGEYSEAIDAANHAIKGANKNTANEAIAYSNRGKIFEGIGKRAVMDFKRHDEIIEEVNRRWNN